MPCLDFIFGFFYFIPYFDKTFSQIRLLPNFLHSRQRAASDLGLSIEPVRPTTLHHRVSLRNKEEETLM